VPEKRPIQKFPFKRTAAIQNRAASRPIFAAFKQRGFTLVEVLVAILVALIFVSVTMQMFVSAAFFRARADQYNQAFNWIQEDYESVFTKANQYEMNAQPYSTLCDATNPVSGLAASFLNDATNGLGSSTTTLGPRQFGGKSFILTRTGDYANSPDPYKLLQLNYRVALADGSGEVARISTEVAIHSAFKCLS
jgi:prepilin-type N-terminal cleavage/methylation domain-containing protein